MWWPPRGLRNLQRRFSSVFVCLRPKTINHQSTIGEQQEVEKNETKIAKGSEGLQISLAIIARDFSIGRSFPEELRRRRYDLSARAPTTTAQVRLVGFLSLFFFFLLWPSRRMIHYLCERNYRPKVLSEHHFFVILS